MHKMKISEKNMLIISKKNYMIDYMEFKRMRKNAFF